MKNIIILGAGFGGIQTALTLSKKLKKIKVNDKYKLIVIDKKKYHTFTPLLYEIATTSEEIAHDIHLKSFVTYNLENVFRNRDIDIIQDNVLHIDINEKSVHLEHQNIQFEYLIIALGSETNYFNITGLKKYALFLKTFDDAIAIRNKIAYESSNKDKLKIAIGGGGATGVELAGEIKSWGCGLTGELNNTCDIDISIVNSSETILASLDKRVIKRTTNRLKKLDIKIISAKIIEVDEKNIITKNSNKIQYDIFIWAGGVKATSLTKNLPPQYKENSHVKIINESECIPVSQELNVYKNIYAIGDIASMYDPKTMKPTPFMARPAIVEGRIAAKNIIEKIKNKNNKITKKFFYKHKNYPYIIPVGGKFAVAKIGPFVISGIFGWIFKGVTELNYFISILPFFRAIGMWFRGFLIFIKNDRLG